MYDGLFQHLHFDADRLAARGKKGTMTNILFFDGHAASFDTNGLPGRMGDNPSGADIFTNQALLPFPELLWTLQQR